MYGVVAGEAPVLNLDASWKSVITFKLRLLNPQENSLYSPLNRRLSVAPR